MNTGSSTSDSAVTCQESVNMTAAVRTSWMTLLTTPDRVEVNACWAPAHRRARGGGRGTEKGGSPPGVGRGEGEPPLGGAPAALGVADLAPAPHRPDHPPPPHGRAPPPPPPLPSQRPLVCGTPLT